MTSDTPENIQDTSPATRRRVYELPTELVERIVEFQKDRGLPSEVEAARRLLDQALKSRDTIESLVGRYLSALGPGIEPGEAAGVVLSGHPLVRGIDFEDDGIAFRFQSPNKDVQIVNVRSSEDIEITTHGNGHYPQTLKLSYDASRPVGHRLDVPDELPF
ncbi:hypothetical protein CLG85_001635 [Yangia mangrovi]|uniref:Uncharacterized protein n=1 Tax=Alloyangia mangrovi TaxID=1779329 RepID=A0ABT2KGB9_9RHOB|nr:hypothetical protein [Alloyangia mangrovi]MCT4369111.1 hypothetical protein [Alloyangia mangrovi]